MTSTPDLTRFTASQLSELMTSRAVSAREVASAHLDRIEAVADASFRAGRLDFATEAYEGLMGDPERTVRLQLKLSDVAHVAGDASHERRLRESIYGRLDVEP